MVIVILKHPRRLTIPQHNGSAVQSLSSKLLQEIENLAGSERRKQEEVVKVALGSIFSGIKIFVDGIHYTYELFF